MLFDRIAELVVGEPNRQAVIIKELRFTFDIEKDTDKATNQLKLKIYNMNPQTRALVERVNNQVILRAGYANDMGATTIFTGTVVSAWTIREDNDVITELSIRDGILPLRQTKLTLSYAPGTPALLILNDIAKSFKLPIKELPQDIPDKVYPRGYAFCGKGDKAMTDVCNYLELTWSIQHHEIQILNKDQPTDSEIIVLTPDSGLIGLPTRILDATRKASQGDLSPDSAMVLSQDLGKDKSFQIEGYKVKCLLQPRLYPGCYVGLESNMLLPDPSASYSHNTRPRAFFRAEVVTHRGDTHEGEWVTECELKTIPSGAKHGRK